MTHSKRTPKKADKKRQQGFTLIELLAVIAIISILSVLSIGAVRSVINSGKRAATEQMCHQIVQGVDRFYAEYNRFPVPEDQAGANGLVELWWGGNGGAKFLSELTGEQSGDGTINHRAIKFISIDDSKNKINGLRRAANGDIRALQDGWGNGLRLRLDYDYDGVVIPIPDHRNADLPGISADEVQARCIVWGLGQDGVVGTKDDTVSWDSK